MRKKFEVPVYEPKIGSSYKSIVPDQFKVGAQKTTSSNSPTINLLETPKIRKTELANEEIDLKTLEFIRELLASNL